MARNKYPEETRKKILNVSQKLFMEKGFEETTVIDIVNNLGGLTRGAFYHHFKSKEEVLDALSNELFYENNPFEMVKKETDLTGLEKIKLVIKLQFQNQEQQDINAMAVSLLDNPRMFTDFYKQGQDVVAKFFDEFVQEGIADGSIKNIKYPHTLAKFFVLLTDTWLVSSISLGSMPEVYEKLDFIKDTFERMDMPVLDDELMALVKQTLTRFEIK